MMNVRLAALALCLMLPCPARAVTPAAPVSSISTAPAPLPLSLRDQKQAADESKQGETDAAEIAKTAKFVTDKAVTDRVNSIGQKLAAVANTTQYPAEYGNNTVYPFTWRFFVIQNKEVNAFSLPGGYVYVYKGLLDNVRSDDELAGVLGHEITHAAHHHIQALSHEASKMNAQMMAGLLAAVLAHVPAADIGNLYQGASLLQEGVMNIHFSQAAERDADHGGTILMAKAGYNPVGMLTFMEHLADLQKRQPDVVEGIMQDHPYETERVTLIQAELAQMKVPVTARAVREATGAARAAVLSPTPQTRAIVFASKTLATLSDPDGTRAQTAAAALNTLLDNGLMLYQVKSDGTRLLAADRPVLQFTPADAALSPGSDPAALADAASKALRSGLYAQTLAGNTAP